MGIFKVSTANIVSLALTLLTSFILPIFISVEQYGYWQLFSMYFGYLGFFVLGFNDGVLLNYAAYNYDEKLAAKFGTFKKFLTIMTLIETVILIVVLFLSSKERNLEFYVYLLCIINILPMAINGLFTYMNQTTMRFSQYAVGNIFGNVAFSVIMVVLLICGAKKALYYIIAYTVAKYLVIGYYRITSKMVFTIKKEPFFSLKGEIIKNFKDGFPLMIASVFHGTIILVSRLLVENRFGIETFSAYSFSLHTIVVATQFIGAISTVFYPIMKRTDGNILGQMYNSFDKIATIVSALLLLSYFLVIIAVKVIYAKYIVILDYLFWVYPLFIFQCKTNILVSNLFKVKNQPKTLIVIYALGTLINMAFVFTAYHLFESVYAIACAVLLGYALWYYLCQIYIYRIEHWKLKMTVFYDLLLVSFFEVIVIVIKYFVDNIYSSAAIGLMVFLMACGIIYLLNKSRINASLKEFKRLLKD